MKCCKKILIIWICAIAVVAVSVIVALYDNANRGQDMAKEVAVETLRKVAERIVNREFDGLGMFYVSGPDSGKKHTKRKTVSEDGEFEVVIDSLKEAQGLFPLDVAGFKANMLNYYGKFPLEEICLEWKTEMNDSYDGTMCALFLKVNPPGKGIVQESSAGDEAIIASQNDLGTYYLDGMYTMRLTAYMLPGFWHCVDWADHALLILSCMLCILLFFVLGCVSRMYRRLFVKEMPVVIEKEIPVIAGHESRSRIYRLEDGLRFDADLNLLKKGDMCVKLAPLSARLLQGFLDAQDFKLSNDEILNLLWRDGSGTSDKLHTNIRRLRGYLSQISNYTIKNENLGYQLKKPHFIEESPA